MALTFNPIDLTNSPSFCGASVNANPGRQHKVISRIGSALYASLLCNGSLPAGGSQEQPMIYKSADAGVSWAFDSADTPPAYPGSIPASASFSYLASGSSALRFLYGAPITGSPQKATIGRSDFTPGSGWSSVTGIGGGLQTQSIAADSRQAPVCCEFTRGDGTRIIIYGNSPSDNSVQIVEDNAGTWTLLAQIDETSVGGGSADYNLMNAHQVGDVVHVFFSKTVFSAPRHSDLYHVSVSAANAVSSLHLVEASIETGTATDAYQSSGRCDSSSDGLTVAFAYPYQPIALAPNGELHVAIGDLSGDPLNPSWTTEAVTGSQVFPPFNRIEASVSFQGGTSLTAYWLDGAYNAGSGWTLVSSTRTSPGTWSGFTTLYGPTTASYTGANAICGFDLLNAFVGGVGILIEYNDGSGNPIVGYNGPPLSIRKNNYAGSGGSMACKGNYAAAG